MATTTRRSHLSPRYEEDDDTWREEKQMEGEGLGGVFRSPEEALCFCFCLATSARVLPPSQLTTHNSQESRGVFISHSFGSTAVTHPKERVVRLPFVLPPRLATSRLPFPHRDDTSTFSTSHPNERSGMIIN
ncbi:hypothetical protein H6P81_015171 [Aristolochia fimbriata]|uniref:Uncharacterized protein n=1 Tax=Aristolochia fimbriata TaxID=158543 RepID=A0AAV7E7L2_ARIFI|nr:hypothetical protein H6P81_015171 [Aristolochia fimbriata]